MKFDTMRMCRVNGCQPTMREKWTAFYRLWRSCGGRDPANTACDALRVLMPCGKWLRLANGNGDAYESLRFMPIPIRRMRVERMRKNRLAARLLDMIMREDE